MGAWIETSWNTFINLNPTVAPYVGAWIETPSFCMLPIARQVAPYVGAWIETATSSTGATGAAKSHPTWVRGLKHLAPHFAKYILSRTLRGCVD